MENTKKSHPWGFFIIGVGFLVVTVGGSYLISSLNILGAVFLFVIGLVSLAVRHHIVSS